ncbi:MAG: hypothetical protein LC793_24070, partial [Thermomicrobia bacterium]|nr:hypothetical protein [Thermomicrobia bacterium]
MIEEAIEQAEPTDPDHDGDNDTEVEVVALYASVAIYYTMDAYDDYKSRPWSFDPATRTVTVGPAVSVMRKTIYLPVADGAQESARPEKMYVSEAGKRHSADDMARLHSMHQSAHAIIVHAGAIGTNVDPDNDGDNDLLHPDVKGKEAAVTPKEPDQNAAADGHARLRSIHDSAHSIAHHAVTMMGPSAPNTATYGGSFLPLMQSARESEMDLQESGVNVRILEVGMATISESKSAPNKGVFEMTIIRPGFNTSGSRYYTKEAIAEAATKQLFDGKKMYVDHPTAAEEKALPERSVSRIGAVIKETYLGNEGELRGKAAIVNPQLKEMLSLMKEQGVLHHIGVSINALGSVKEGEMEGRKTNIVKGFTEGKSVDFVTEPGAGGRIALYESDRGGKTVIEVRKETTVTEEQIQKVLSELAGLKESNQKLEDKLTESDKRATEAEARAKVQATVATRLAGIPETELPVIAKARVARMFESATDDARLDEVIESEKGYVKEVAEKL